MTEQEQPSLDSWDDYIDTWLKAKDFKAFPDKVFMVRVKSTTNQRGENVAIYDSQYDKKKFKWSPNKTQIKKLKALGFNNPKSIIEKFVWFNKVRVYDPTKQANVDGLEIEKVE